VAELPETKVNFRKDLLKEVTKICDLTGHSAKMFIEEGIKALLEQVHADGEVVPVPALVAFVRMRLGKNTQTLKEQVEKLVEPLREQVKELDDHDALQKLIESVVEEKLKTQDLNTAAPVLGSVRTSGITGTVRKRPGIKMTK
jgi:hypothetical protein